MLLSTLLRNYRLLMRALPSRKSIDVKLTSIAFGAQRNDVIMTSSKHLVVIRSAWVLTALSIALSRCPRRRSWPGISPHRRCFPARSLLYGRSSHTRNSRISSSDGYSIFKVQLRDFDFLLSYDRLFYVKKYGSLNCKLSVNEKTPCLSTLFANKFRSIS